MSATTKRILPGLEANLKRGYIDLSGQVEKLTAELERLCLRFALDTGQTCATCELPILQTAYVGVDDPTREPLCRACYLQEEYDDLVKRVEAGTA